MYVTRLTTVSEPCFNVHVVQPFIASFIGSICKYFSIMTRNIFSFIAMLKISVENCGTALPEYTHFLKLQLYNF